MGNLTFAVAGNGPANNENIVELLNDWLGFGEKDEEGYYASDAVKYDDVRLILPLTDEQFTPGVAMVHRWSALANLGFVGVISSTTMPTRRDVKGAKGEADDLLPAGNVFDGMLDLLAEADPGDDTALLVLMEDTDPDEETRALVEHAFERGITTVLNLSYGLAPLEAPAAPEPEPQAQESGYAALAASQDAEDEAFHAAMRARRHQEPVIERLPLVEQMLGAEGEIARIAYREVVTTHINRGGELEGDPVGNVFGILERLLQFHAAYDKVNRLTTTGLPSGPGSALTDDLLRAVCVLQHLLLPDTVRTPVAQETVTAPVQATEAVTVEKPAGKTRTEFFDEESGEWKPKGRGRPRKGVQLREVPVED